MSIGKPLYIHCLRKIEKFDVNVVLENMSKCECFIGMVLHSLIFASILNTKLIRIGYHQKVKVFCNGLGYSQYYVDYTDFCSEKLINLVEELINDKISYDDEVESFYNLCMNSYAEINEKLEQSYRYKKFKAENKNMEQFLIQNKISLD